MLTKENEPHILGLTTQIVTTDFGLDNCPANIWGMAT